MNKVFIITVSIYILTATFASAQSSIVGRVDNDGVAHMTVAKSQASEVLQQATNARVSQSAALTDVSFSRMALGEICLTAYEKDNYGRIISGIRIKCYQDDANNLIVLPENKIEKIYGRQFAGTTVISE